MLAQERKSGKPLPIEAVNRLCKVEGLGWMLVEMGQSYRVDELAARYLVTETGIYLIWGKLNWLREFY